MPPGPDRFWGQFSEARGGRSSADDEPQAEAGPDEKGNGNGDHAESRHECLEWCPICRSAELLKAAGVASPEIRAQIHSIQNEAITILKAFAASYAERTGEDPFSRGKGESDGNGRGNGNGAKPGPDEPKVTDISIE